MARLPVLCVAVALFSISPGAQAEPPAGDPCDIVPWQTVNQGMGAEAGVVREFAARMTVPAGCHRGGKTWVTRMWVGVTRVAPGGSDMAVRVSLRAPQSSSDGPLPPGDDRTDPLPVQLEGVPMFPGQEIFELDVGPNANGNLNDGVYGTEFFASVDMDGDQTMNQFLVADEVGPGDEGCFTGMNGATPVDPCTTGNPNLSAPGLGAGTYTFYGRYATGESVQGREPLGTLWGARYIDSGAAPGGLPNLRVWRESPGNALGGDETICQFNSIPDDFSFQCTLTAAQLTSLGEGRVFVELTGGGPTRNTRMIPADLFLFADGFESGDTSEWNVTVQ